MGVHLGINDDLTEKQKAELEIDDVTHFVLRRQKSSGIVFTDANFYKYQIYFTPYQATSIIFHLDPYDKGNEHHSSDFKAVQEVLKQYTECGMLKKSRIKAEKDPFLGDIETIQIHRDDLTFFVSLLNIPSFNGLPEILANKESEPDKQIAELQARIAELEAEKQNPKKPEPKEDVQEYDGDIPPQTDRDKLAKTFRLVIQQSKFIEMNNGRYPTYSQLHTMLNHIYPKEQIPSKNTLKKYLEP